MPMAAAELPGAMGKPAEGCIMAGGWYTRLDCLVDMHEDDEEDMDEVDDEEDRAGDREKEPC